MLSDREIKKYIGQGKIKISPFVASQLGPSHYKVRLGKTLLIPKAGQLIDLRLSEVEVPYKKIELTEMGYILEPNQFLLGQTLELVAMDKDILIFIDGRSILARLGISIHQCSTTLLPGQESHIITLEIFNAGKFRVKLYPNLKVGKIIFFQSKLKNSKGNSEYGGLYSGQKETTGAKLKQL